MSSYEWMTRLLRGGAVLALLVGALALGACRGDDAEEAEGGDMPDVEMEAGPLFVDDVSAEAGDDGSIEVTLTGNFPNACSVVGESTTTVDGNTITVEIGSAKPVDVMCAQQLTPFEETTTIEPEEPLAPGEYTLVVNERDTTFTVE